MYYTMCTAGEGEYYYHDVVQLYMWRSSRYLLQVLTPSELLTNYISTSTSTLAGGCTAARCTHVHVMQYTYHLQ